MSTLTVCPHCGKQMQFAVMKTHLDCCEERPLRMKLRQSPPARHPATAAAGKSISGLEFYHRLNKLSRLTRLSRSTSSGDNNGPTASPRKAAVTATQQRRRSPSSVLIDVAQSSTPSSASSPRYASVEPPGRPSSSWAPYSDVSGSATSPPAPPPPSSPSAHVDVKSQSEETDVSSRGVGARLRPASRTPSSARSPSADPFSATPATPARAASSKPKSAAEYTTNAAWRHPCGTSQSRSNHRTGESGLPIRYPISSVRAASPSERRVPEDSVAAAAGESALPSSIAELSSTRSAAPTGLTASSAESAVSSVTSTHRPMPQLSSFAIRLRGRQGSVSSAHKAAPTDSRRPPRRLRDSGDVADTLYGNGDVHSVPLLGPESKDVAQIKADLWQMQQLARQQQAQYTALLHAHGDLQRQVTAQRDALNGMVRRSMGKAAAMEAALQKHAEEGRRELAAMQESVTSLWASFSDVQKRLRDDTRSSAKALEGPCSTETAARTSICLLAPPSPSLQKEVLKRQQARYASQLVATPLAPNAITEKRQEPSASIIVQRSIPGEESAYYSDIASFIRPDVPTTSLLSETSTSRKVAPPAPAQTPGSVLTSELVHPSASSSVSVSSFIPGGAAPSAAAARAPPYAMDVQQRQQRRRESIEERVVLMLHAKPTVVVRHSTWKQQ
ncbi:hypothetical protein CUR178_00655 [Leishmania enriettii]|uniref:Uncharacterized protein n=1 Tax=Leishmania enriettii TaxID=5663 RepID=A0A836GW76_LEIEN|nr:hypothetical protein CUR178_00655 [Leishmania enriettii]